MDAFFAESLFCRAGEIVAVATRNLASSFQILHGELGFLGLHTFVTKSTNLVTVQLHSKCLSIFIFNNFVGITYHS